MAEKSRSCYTCAHFNLCFLRHRIWDEIAGVNMINIDGDGAPGRMNEVFEALGRACTQYEFREER